MISLIYTVLHEREIYELIKADLSECFILVSPVVWFYHSFNMCCINPC